MRYSKTVYEMLEDIVDDLKEPFAPKDVIELIHKKFPRDNVKANTITCHVISSAVNHPSRHWHLKPQRQGKHQLFFYVTHGTFRKYNPTKDGRWVVDEKGPRRVDEEFEYRKETKGEGNEFFSKVNINNQIVIPAVIREKLDIEPDSYVAFLLKNDEIFLKKAELKIVK